MSVRIHSPLSPLKSDLVDSVCITGTLVLSIVRTFYFVGISPLIQGAFHLRYLSFLITALSLLSNVLLKYILIAIYG